MRFVVPSFSFFCLMGSLVGGVAFAQTADFASSMSEERSFEQAANDQGSRWYCVSESPSNPQSSGHIGYGHGKSREESARKAVEACRLDGGYGECREARCFPE